MIYLMRKAVFALSFSLLTLNPTCAADFAQEKALLDAHSPAVYPDHINYIKGFALNAIEQTEDPRFQKALVHLGMKEGGKLPDVQESYEYDVIVGGLFRLNELSHLQNPTGVDVIEAIEVASALLSPKLFPKEFEYSYKYVIYDAVLDKRNRLFGFGYCQQKKADAEKLVRIRDKLYEERDPRDGSVVSAKYFSVMAWSRNGGLFSPEAYVYALGKKKTVLYALADKPNPVHGGIITHPLELFVHDGAHNNDILSTDDAVTDEQLQKVADIVTTLASRIYDIIYNPDVFHPDERANAFSAAANLLHENQIAHSTKSLCKPCFPWDNELKERFKVIKNRFNMTLESYFNVVASPKPPSTLSEQERRIEKLKEMMGDVTVQTDNFYFNEKLASDAAKEICQIYPQAETEIFGTETNTNRNFEYHGENALKWIKILMEWFYERIDAHI